MSSEPRDWYAVLGLPHSSSKEDIQRAVRKLSLKYHSDKTDDADAPEKFLAVQQAKEILLGRDPISRIFRRIVLCFHLEKEIFYFITFR